MITVGTMRLPQPEPLDDLEAFLRGLEPDGGYWATMRRLADHDHSGGLMGVPVSGGGGGTAGVTITGTEGVTVVESPENTFALGLTASAAANNTIEIRADGIYSAAGAIPPEYVTDAELAAALGAHTGASDPHPAYVHVAGDTVSGPLAVGSAAGAQPLVLDGPAGTVRPLFWRTAGVARWRLGTDTEAESGDNFGASLRLDRYDDAGGLLGTLLVANRRAGTLDVNGVLSMGGQRVLTQPTTDGLYVSVSGDAMYGPLRLGGDVETERFLAFQTGFSPGPVADRFRLGVDGSSEAGGDLGSNFVIERVRDGGGRNPALVLNRATGACTLYGAVAITGALTVNDGLTVAGVTFQSLLARITALETSVAALKVHAHELGTFGAGTLAPTGGIP